MERRNEVTHMAMSKSYSLLYAQSCPICNGVVLRRSCVVSRIEPRLSSDKTRTYLYTISIT